MDLFLPSICRSSCLIAYQFNSITHFANDSFKFNFLNENLYFDSNFVVKFTHKGLSNNMPSLVQAIALGQTGDKTLSESIMAYFSDAYMCHLASIS